MVGPISKMRLERPILDNQMPRHWTGDNSLIAAAIMSPEAVAVSMTSDDRNTEEPFSFVAVWVGGEWKSAGGGAWDTVAMTLCTVPDQEFVVASPQGFMFCVGRGVRHEEEIVDGDVSPATLGFIRDVVAIDGKTFACGMKRQVYRRDGRNIWTSISRQIHGGRGLTGFEAIDGFSETDVYAVGWEGEIWHFDGRGWTQAPSPTNELLVDVCCAGDGLVYAVGRAGNLIVGRGDEWRATPLNLPHDLWSLCWFQGKLYAASKTDLWVYQGPSFAPIRIEGDFPATAGCLTASPDVMWSVGAKDAFAFDGTAWSRIE